MKKITLISWLCGSLIIGLVVLSGCNQQTDSSKDSIKIGYLVKMPEEPWFQVEWAFADKAGKDFGFEVIKLAVPDAEKTLAAIDNLAAQGASGFVICTPDVRLGPAIVAKAKANNLKFMTVDDQLLGADGKILTDVHHLGIFSRDVGHAAGQALWDEFKKRKWPIEDTAVCVVTYDELDTAYQRTEGIIEKLIENGFPADRIFRTPQKTTDIPGAFDATNNLLTQHPNVKYWLAGGVNDNTALGATRALEGRNFDVNSAIAVGINGTDCIDEFKKATPTPFFGSILMEANVHGYDSTVAVYKWVKEGIEPEKSRLTGGILITRETFEKELKAHGMWPEESKQ